MSEVILVSKSVPVIEGLQSPEEFIAYAARVSNPSNQMNAETAPKLLKYLIKNKHWSPLEMVSLTMEINTTRDIARQILRHRSFSFQEFSQRYADAQALGFEMREARMQDTKNRQNSVEVDDELMQQTWTQYQTMVSDASVKAYNWALDNGIAKEQARAVLPEGITKSRLYMAGTLRSWIHYCQLRCGNGTQKEHRIIADQAWEIICKEFPSISEITSSIMGEEK